MSNVIKIAIYILLSQIVGCAGNKPIALFQSAGNNFETATLFTKNYLIDSQNNEHFIYVIEIQNNDKTIKLNDPSRVGNSHINFGSNTNSTFKLKPGKYNVVVEVWSPRGLLGNGTTYISKASYDIVAKNNITYFPVVKPGSNRYADSFIVAMNSPYKISCGEYFSDKSGQTFDEEQVVRRDCEDGHDNVIASSHIETRSVRFTMVLY